MSSLLSVIITAYNRERTIQRCIDSVLNQSYKNIEIIVIDDNSQDDTFKIIKSYVDKRIKIYKNEVNLGAAKNKYLGTKLIQGEYFVFLDSDDYYIDDCFFEKAMKIFAGNSDISMIMARSNIIKKQNIETNNLNFNGLLSSKEYIDNYQTKYNRTVQNAIICKSEVFFQSEVKGFNYLDDALMILRGIGKNKLIYGMNDVVTVYEMSENSISRNVDKDLIKCHILGTIYMYHYYKKTYDLAEEWLVRQIKYLLSFYAWGAKVNIRNICMVYCSLKKLKLHIRLKLFIQYCMDCLYIHTKGKHDHDMYN